MSVATRWALALAIVALGAIATGGWLGWELYQDLHETQGRLDSAEFELTELRDAVEDTAADLEGIVLQINRLDAATQEDALALARAAGSRIDELRRCFNDALYDTFDNYDRAQGSIFSTYTVEQC